MRGGRLVNWEAKNIEKFLYTPPSYERGGGDATTGKARFQYFYTLPSYEGETFHYGQIRYNDISIHSPSYEGETYPDFANTPIAISIHSPRMRGDMLSAFRNKRNQFLYTPLV